MPALRNDTGDASCSPRLLNDSSIISWGIQVDTLDTIGWRDEALYIKGYIFNSNCGVWFYKLLDKIAAGQKKTDYIICKIVEF